MNSDKNVGTQELSTALVGGGCLVSIPLMIGFGFKFALNYAKKKEHQFSHQVEEVELEGAAAAKLDEGLTPQEALQRFVKKIERITEQYQKMGARFSPKDFQGEKGRLDQIRSRLGENAKEGEAATLLTKADQLLQQYAPQG